MFCSNATSFFQTIFQTRILTETTWIHCDSSESTGATICVRCAAEILVSDYLNGILVSLDCCIFLCTSVLFLSCRMREQIFFLSAKTEKYRRVDLLRTSWKPISPVMFICHTWKFWDNMIYDTEMNIKLWNLLGANVTISKKKINWVPVVPCGYFTDIKTQHYFRNCNEFICTESSEQLYYNSVQYIELNDWRSAGFNLHPIILCAFGNICF